MALRERKFLDSIMEGGSKHAEAIGGEMHAIYPGSAAVLC